MRTFAAVLLVALSAASCGTPQVQFDEIAPSEFGSRPDAALLHVKTDEYLERVLIDPDSRRVRWIDSSPRRAAWGRMFSPWNYGWGMRFGLNSKNRMGGYTGERAYFILEMKDGHAIVAEMPGGNRFQMEPTNSPPAR